MKPLLSPLHLLPAGEVRRSQAQSRPEACCCYQWLQARKVLFLLWLYQQNRGHPLEEKSLGDKQQEPGNSPHPGCFLGGSDLTTLLPAQPALGETGCSTPVIRE